ncbi:hypothetical protein BC828DRAFT_403252 [Blastocladiella britannica]|nr:hypothetical protein BC828DRAFT_403252 [Blastocladiella britannica]
MGSLADVSLVLDRILLFASPWTYTLSASLSLLRVLPIVHLPETRRHVFRRLVHKRDLGRLGRPDLIQSLPRPLWQQTVTEIAEGAVIAGHVYVLEWLLTVGLVANQWLFVLAVEYGRTNIMDWCVAHGVTVRTEMAYCDPFVVASYHRQLGPLDWLRAGMVECRL